MTQQRPRAGRSERRRGLQVVQGPITEVHDDRDAGFRQRRRQMPLIDVHDVGPKPFQLPAVRAAEALAIEILHGIRPAPQLTSQVERSLSP